MSEYNSQKEYINNLNAANKIANELPWFAHEYFEAQKGMAGSTRLEYCYILLAFFEYLHHFDGNFTDKEIIDITLSDIARLEKKDYKAYFDFRLCHKIHEGTPDESYVKTSMSTIKRIRACLFSFINYFVEVDKLVNNPITGIKIREVPPRTEAVRQEECISIFDTIQNGKGLDANTFAKSDYSKERDLAIVALLFYSKLRISEITGIDVADIDMQNKYIRIITNANKHKDVNLSGKEFEYLAKYLEVREVKFKPYETDALFLNKYGSRISERSVERMIKKYSEAAFQCHLTLTPNKIRMSKDK